MVYRTQGDFLQAEALAHKALDLVRSRESVDPLDEATALTHLASVYQAMDAPMRAEAPARAALDIRRRILGAAHPVTASSLKNVATLYQTAGRTADAEALFKEALEAYRKSVGDDHPECIETLRLLAALHQGRGDSAAAEPLIRQSTDIVRRLFGEESAFLAPPLTQLADCFRARGDHPGAEVRYRQALDIVRKARTEAGQPGEPGQPQVPGKLPFLDRSLSLILNNLALLYTAMGRTGQSEPLLRQAMEVDKQCLGDEHVDTLFNLAGVCAACGREAEAMTLLEKVSAFQDGLIPHVAALSSDSARESFLQSYYRCYQARLTLLVRHFGESPEAVRAGCDLVLQRKLRWVEMLGAAVRSNGTPAGSQRELLVLHRQIATKMLNGPGFEGLANHQRLLARWQSRVHELKEEARQSEIGVNAATVAKALPPDAALLEYARFTTFDFNASVNGEARQQPARYVVFVVRPGAPAAVKLIDLGAAEKIDRLISVTRLAFVRGDKLGPTAGLREVIFDPAALVAQCKRLVIALDGELVHVPFVALPTTEGRSLFDDYEILGTTTGRDLLDDGRQSASPADPVVAGDPDFEYDLNASGLPELPPPRFLDRTKSALRSLFRLQPPPQPTPAKAADSDPQRIQFRSLGASDTEETARLLSVQPLRGRRLLKNRILECKSPRVLHLSVPGFFLAGPAEGNTSPLPRRDKLLLRSGLALTGANASIAGRELLADAGDGLLTTQDILGMDLLGTELVILPACGAGAFELGSGPALIALQRACLLAGARTLILTLWQPPSDARQALLADFYRLILAGRNPVEALRAAQQATKVKYPDPRGWAAFVAIGKGKLASR
jgi:tetratricopeptide (TPR) repeat protein